VPQVTARRWTGENGVEVETTTLHGREVFRVSQGDYFIAYCDTMDDVSTFVALDTLVELADLYGPDEPAG
jgi:hypothetical protein